MKPELFWESLSTDDRNLLSDVTGISKDLLSKQLNCNGRGTHYMAADSAWMLCDHINTLFNVTISYVELVNPKFRKALKQLEKK